MFLTTRAWRAEWRPESWRSPKLPPLVFKAQACQRDALHVGVGWPTPPSPCRFCARPTASSRGGRAAGPGLRGGLLRREAVLPQVVAVRGARLVPEGFAGCDAGPGRLPLGPHRVGHLRAEPQSMWMTCVSSSSSFEVCGGSPLR